MWANILHTLQPLTRLVSKEENFKWTDIEQKWFDEVKRKLAHNILLSYIYFNKLFELHMDDRNL